MADGAVTVSDRAVAGSDALVAEAYQRIAPSDRRVAETYRALAVRDRRVATQRVIVTAAVGLAGRLLRR